MSSSSLGDNKKGRTGDSSMFTRNVRQLAIASGIKSGLGSKSVKTLYGSAAMSDVAGGDAANLVLINLVNNNSGVTVSSIPSPSVSVTDGFWVCGYYSSALLTIYNSDGSPFVTFDRIGATDGFLVKYNSEGNAQWATRMGGAGIDQAFSLAVDSLGNVYVSGNYASAPLTIYNADASIFRTLDLIGATDGFLVKYNSVGNAQWATRLGSTGTDGMRSVGTDFLGNVYVSGNYPSTSSLMFYNADLITFGTLAPLATNNGFIVKYNSEGTAVWAARVGGTTSTLFTYLMTVDSSGNVYVSGKSNTSGGGIVLFQNSDGTSGGSLTVSGTTNRFIVKYDSAGMVQWKTRITFATTVVDQSYSVAVDSLGNVYASGTYSGGTSAMYSSDESAFATSLASIGSNDVYIVKYNSAGMVQWVTRMGGTLSDNAFSTTADSLGNVYITGNYSSSPLTVYNSDGSQFGTLALTTASDGFLVKYNSAGIAQWVTRVTGSGSDQPFSTTLDSLGNIYISGQYGSSPLTVYNSDGSQFGTLALTTTVDGFLVKYNSAGIAQLATRMTGDASDTAYKVVAYTGF